MIIVQLLLKPSKSVCRLIWRRTKHLLISDAPKAELPHGVPRNSEIHHLAETRNSGSQHFDSAQLRRNPQIIAREHSILCVRQLRDPVEERKVVKKTAKNG